MKIGTTSFLIVGCLCACSLEAHAQMTVEFGPRLGIDLNNSRLFLGGEARITDQHFFIVINPTLDYHFVEGDRLQFSDLFGTALSANFSADLWQLGIKGLYPFIVRDQPFIPYVGGGLVFSRLSASFDISSRTDNERSTDSDMAFGVTLIGGATFPVGKLKFFAQGEITKGARFTLFDIKTDGGDFLLWTAGLLFRL